jgi:hypothetical protein
MQSTIGILSKLDKWLEKRLNGKILTYREIKSKALAKRVCKKIQNREGTK